MLAGKEMYLNNNELVFQAVCDDYNAMQNDNSNTYGSFPFDIARSAKNQKAIVTE